MIFSTLLFGTVCVCTIQYSNAGPVNRRSTGSCNLAAGQPAGFKVYCDLSTSESLCSAYPYCVWGSGQETTVASGKCAPKPGFEAYSLYCGGTDQQSCEVHVAFCEWAAPSTESSDSPSGSYSGSMSQSNDKFCTSTEGLVLLTDTKVDILGSNGAITSCATGLFSAVNAVMDPNGGIYVVEDMGQTVKYIAPSCGSVTETLNAGDGLVRPSAVAYIPNGATGGFYLAVSNSMGTTGYIFEFDASRNKIGSTPLNAPAGLTYISYDGETLSGISSNKIYGVFDDSFTFVPSNEIVSIVDMRQASLGCDGKTYIAADDNNDIFECDDINNPSTCEPLCPIQSGQGVTNPWAVAVGNDCSVYTASRGPGAGNIYKYDSSTCFVPVKIGEFPNGGDGIKAIIPFLESEGECKGIQYVCPENCEDPVPTCNNENSNIVCGPQGPVPDYETKPCNPATTDCQAECCMGDPVETCEELKYECGIEAKNDNYSTVTCDPEKDDCQAICCNPRSCADLAIDCSSANLFNDYQDKLCGAGDSSEDNCLSVCCTPKENCVDNYTCQPSDRPVGPIECSNVLQNTDDKKCDDDLCCEPRTCGSENYMCTGDTRLVTDSSSIKCAGDAECQNKCCETIPDETCKDQSYDCGIEAKDDNYDTVTCNPEKEDCQAMCCNPRSCVDLAIDCSSANLFNDYQDKLCGTGDSSEDNCLSVCCTPKENCVDNYTCQPSDRPVGPIECSNVLQNTDDNKCDDDLCCEPRTCGTENYMCTGDTRLVTGSSSIKCAGDAECQNKCCEAIPDETCKEQSYDCGIEAKDDNYNSVTCDPEKEDCQAICCNPRSCVDLAIDCSSANLFNDYRNKLCGAGDSSEDNCLSVCCTPKENCVDNYTCQPSDRPVGPIECSNVLQNTDDNKCDDDLCCEPRTCGTENYMCTGDTRLVTGSSSIKCAGDAECQNKCCEAIPDETCKEQSYDCGIEAKDDNYNSVTCDPEKEDCQAICCNPRSCVDLAIDCSSQNLFNDYRNKLCGAGKNCFNVCCTPKENCKDNYTCQPNNRPVGPIECSNNLQNSDNNKCDEDLCCEARTCGSENYMCTGNTRLVTGSSSIECAGDVDCQSKCCEAKPTCETVGHFCSEGTALKDNFKDIVCENNADCQNKCCESVCDAQCVDQPNGSPCDGGNGDSKQCINCECTPVTCVDTTECTDFDLDYAVGDAQGYIRGNAPTKQTFSYEGQSFHVDISGKIFDGSGVATNVQPVVFDTHLPVGCCNQNGQRLEDLALDPNFTCNLGGCSCACGNGDIDLIVGDQRESSGGIYKGSDTCSNDGVNRPFSSYGNGNNGQKPRYVLVVPERPFKAGDPCSAPDDNASGGIIELDFSDPLEKGLDFVVIGDVTLLDIEEAREQDTKATLYRYSTKLGEKFMAGVGDNSVVSRSFLDISGGFGFPTGNTVNPTRLEVEFDGSGSLGPLSFQICKPKRNCS